jgi:hypothetical protein
MEELPVGSWWKVKKKNYSFGHPPVGSLVKVERYQPRNSDYSGYTGCISQLTFKSSQDNWKVQNNLCINSIPPEGWIRVEEAESKKLEIELIEMRKRDFTPFVTLTGSYGGNTGSDPEIFVLDKEGKVIPSWKFLPSKATATWGSKIYWDGWQAEFEIAPLGCLASLVDSIHRRLVALHSYAQTHSPGAKLTGESVVEVSPKDLITAAQEYVQFGCMPSENVYGFGGADPGNSRELPLRFAGFHIHQATTLTPPQIAQAIKLADAIAGVLSVVVFQGLERPERRQFYGLAGEYRSPKYGLEYRVISSAALWHPAMTHLMFNMVRSAVRFVEKGLGIVWESQESEVREAINNLDVTLAKRILLHNQPVMEKMLEKLYRDTTQPTISGCEPTDVPSAKRIFEDLLLRGVKQFVDLDVEKNWHLTDNLWKTHSEGPGVMMWRFAKEALRG